MASLWARSVLLCHKCNDRFIDPVMLEENGGNYNFMLITIKALKKLCLPCGTIFSLLMLFYLIAEIECCNFRIQNTEYRNYLIWSQLI